MEERPPLLIRRAALAEQVDADTVIALLDAYARDPMGDGKPLDPAVRERLIPALQAHPTTLIWLAFLGDQAVGIVTAFVGFSTFKAAPLINLHDVAVLPEARGRGVGRALLAAVEEHAREAGCCRLTLEVLEANHTAKSLYETVGYRQVEAADGSKRSPYLFFAKPLS